MGWSMRGLQAAWLHESSFRLEACLVVILVPVAFALGAGPVERIVLIASLLNILAIELLNSAIEAVIDRYGNDWHPVAGRAKDLGSAAVFVAIVIATLSWGLIGLARWLP